MLDTFRLEWLNNSNLAGVQRDMVHLSPAGKHRNGRHRLPRRGVLPCLCAGFSST